MTAMDSSNARTQDTPPGPSGSGASLPGQQAKGLGPKGQLFLAYGLVALFALVVYVPYVAGGGYIQDDWAAIQKARDYPCYWDAVKSWFPYCAFRPLDPFLLQAEAKLFGDRPPLFILANLLLWFAAIGVLCQGLQRYYGPLFGVTLSLLATVPVLSSMVLFWPVIMSCTSLSLLLWSLSLWLLIRSLERGRYSILPYALLLACMGLCEVVLPLFVLTALFPFLWMSARRLPIRPSLCRHVTKYAVPPVAVALLIAVMQKLVLPLFSVVVHSRLQPSVSGAARGIASWVFALGPGQVLLWVHGLWQGLHDWTVALPWLAASAVGLAAFALACRAEAAAPCGTMPASERKKVLWVLLLCLGSCSGLFGLSGQPAYFSGATGNHILISTWVALGMVLAFLAGRWSSKVLRLAVCAILVLSTCGMLVQRNNHIRSWQIQKTVAKVFAETMSKSDVPAGAVVMGDVPRVVGGKYHYAQVFREWDWGRVVAMTSDHRGVSGAVIGRNAPHYLKVARRGDELVIGDRWKASLRDVWLFSFDPQTQAGSLRKINGADDWDRTILEVERRNLNPRPDTIEDSVRKWISHDPDSPGS